jgi:hypothetical protein
MNCDVLIYGFEYLIRRDVICLPSVDEISMVIGFIVFMGILFSKEITTVL